MAVARQRPDLAQDPPPRSGRAPGRAARPAHTAGSRPPYWRLHAAVARRAEVSSGFSGQPRPYARRRRTAASRVTASAASPGGGSAGPWSRPPIWSPARCNRSAIAASRPSDQAGPSTVTPAADRPAQIPPAPRNAARSHRLTKLVNVPSRAFGPIGSAASIRERRAERRRRQQQGIDPLEQARRHAARLPPACGTHRTHRRCAARAPPPGSTRVVGCRISGPSARTIARSALVRSATHGPSYKQPRDLQERRDIDLQRVHPRPRRRIGRAPPPARTAPPPRRRRSARAANLRIAAPQMIERRPRL